MNAPGGTAQSRADKARIVAKNLNDRIDLAGIPEWAEQVGFDWIADHVCALLPDRLLSVMVTASDGISEAEADVAEQIVEQYMRTRLPGLIASVAVVDRVIDRIGDAVHDLLLIGNAA